MINFSQILDKKIAATERPALPPVGTYRFMVTKVPEFSERGDFDVVDFSLKGLEALDDVDADELAAFGDVTSVLMRRSFLFGKGEAADKASFEKTEFGLKQFLEVHLGIDGADKMSYKEAFAAAVNHQCLGTVQHKADRSDPEILHANVTKTMPVS